MLWDIQARMKPAMWVVELIPNIHRTPGLAMLRRAVLEGRPATQDLAPEDKEFAFLDAPLPLTSPIGARVLKQLYFAGHLKLKKPATKSLPQLDTYIATEAAFRADVARIAEADVASHLRLTRIIADPACARPDELTPQLIDKVMTAHLGRGTLGQVRIAGLLCHRTLSLATPQENDRLRHEGRVVCWWMDDTGQRQGDVL